MRLMPAPTASKRVDVEPAVGLVEHCELRIHDAHLHHLGALLFAARKADVDRALQHLDVHAEQRRLLARKLDEFAARKLGFAARTALRIEAFAQELEVRDAGNFDRILEAEEQARRGALVRLHREQILAVERRAAFGHFIAGPPEST